MKRNIVIVGILIIAVAVVFELKKHKPAPVEGPAPVSAPLPRLLELGSVKCVPCKMMAPILDEMRETFAGQLRVDFIDVWQTKGVSEQYDVNMIPTQIFFDADGNELFRHEGFFARDDIIATWKELGFVFNQSQNEEGVR